MQIIFVTSKVFTVVTMAASSLTVIGFLGLLTIISADSLITSVSPQCAPPPFCDNKCLQYQPLCRADGLYWEEMKENNVSGGHNILMEHEGLNLYLGQFFSKDKQLHVSTVDFDGSLLSNNGGDVASSIKIMKNHGKKFSYIQTWPGSMLSSYHRGSPDLREATSVVGVQDGQAIYFGRTVTEPVYYGTVVLSENKLTYELRYADEHNKQQRNKTFLVLISNECHDVLVAAFPGENAESRDELTPRIARLLQKYYDKDTS